MPSAETGRSPVLKCAIRTMSEFGIPPLSALVGKKTVQFSSSLQPAPHFRDIFQGFPLLEIQNSGFEPPSSWECKV